MHFIYIDDSQDQNTGSYAFSALAVPAELWREMFGSIRDFRRAIRDSDGIFMTKELHAWKFVSGRGRISNGIVTKSRRCEIFLEALQLLAKQEGLRSSVVQRRNEE